MRVWTRNLVKRFEGDHSSGKIMEDVVVKKHDFRFKGSR